MNNTDEQHVIKPLENLRHANQNESFIVEEMQVTINTHRKTKGGVVLTVERCTVNCYSVIWQQ